VKDSAVVATDGAAAHVAVSNVDAAKTTVGRHVSAVQHHGAVEKRTRVASRVAAGGTEGDPQTVAAESDARTPDAITASGSADVKQSTAHANAAVGITSATAEISGAAPADRSSLPTSAAGHGEVRSEPPLTTETMPANVTAIAARAAEALRHGEVRLGWDSEQLGRVDIKATVHGQEVAAAVKVESDAGRQWMTSELPKLADALGRQDFTVRSLQVMDFSAGDGQAQGGGNAQQQRWSHRSASGGGERQGQAASALSTLDEESQQGLSIHV
jgi:flagellar hook-length control protein FliK